MDAIKESGKPKRLPKPKLPRKRKKAAIKAQGRKWYYDTIKLWLASKDEPWFNEPNSLMVQSILSLFLLGIGKYE